MKIYPDQFEKGHDSDENAENRIMHRLAIWLAFLSVFSVFVKILFF